MPGAANRKVRQSPLSLPSPDGSRNRLSHRTVQTIWLRCPESIGRILVETPLSSPSHVLDREERTVDGQGGVECTIANERVVGELDHTLEGAVGSRRVLGRQVGVVDVDWCGAGGEIERGRHVQGELDVGAVEVVDGAGGEVVAVGVWDGVGDDGAEGGDWERCQ